MTFPRINSSEFFINFGLTLASGCQFGIPWTTLDGQQGPHRRETTCSAFLRCVTGIISYAFWLYYLPKYGDEEDTRVVVYNAVALVNELTFLVTSVHCEHSVWKALIVFCMLVLEMVVVVFFVFMIRFGVIGEKAGENLLGFMGATCASVRMIDYCFAMQRVIDRSDAPDVRMYMLYLGNVVNNACWLAYFLRHRDGDGHVDGYIVFTFVWGTCCSLVAWLMYASYTHRPHHQEGQQHPRPHEGHRHRHSREGQEPDVDEPDVDEADVDEADVDEADVDEAAVDVDVELQPIEDQHLYPLDPFGIL